MADPLHFGYFSGLPSKLIWFVFGAGMSALCITRVALYGSRVARTLQRREASAPARVAA
jgi:uncharacterized iron-regulated membrane protein